MCGCGTFYILSLQCIAVCFLCLVNEEARLESMWSSTNHRSHKTVVLLTTVFQRNIILMGRDFYICKKHKVLQSADSCNMLSVLNINPSNLSNLTSWDVCVLFPVEFPVLYFLLCVS